MIFIYIKEETQDYTANVIEPEIEDLTIVLRDSDVKRISKGDRRGRDMRNVSKKRDDRRETNEVVAVQISPLRM